MCICGDRGCCMEAEKVDNIIERRRIRKLEAQQQAAVDDMEKVRGEIAMEKSQHPPQLPVPPLAYGCAAGDATTQSG